MSSGWRQAEPKVFFSLFRIARQLINTESAERILHIRWARSYINNWLTMTECKSVFSIFLYVRIERKNLSGSGRLTMNHHLRLIFQVQFLIKVFTHSICVFWKKWNEERSSTIPITVSDILFLFGCTYILLQCLVFI